MKKTEEISNEKLFNVVGFLSASFFRISYNNNNRSLCHFDELRCISYMYLVFSVFNVHISVSSFFFTGFVSLSILYYFMHFACDMKSHIRQLQHQSVHVVRTYSVPWYVSLTLSLPVALCTSFTRSFFLLFVK